MPTAETIAAAIAASWPDMPADQVDERARVLAALQTWMRTPYHHAAKVKGAGVDCATLIAAVYEEAGLLQPAPIPNYSPQWHLHRTIERYRDAVMVHAHEITAEEARPADVALYRFGHVKAHGALITERGWPSIAHAYANAGMVVEGRGDAGMLAGRDVQFFSHWR